MIDQEVHTCNFAGNRLQESILSHSAIRGEVKEHECRAHDNLVFLGTYRCLADQDCRDAFESQKEMAIPFERSKTALVRAAPNNMTAAIWLTASAQNRKP